MPTVHHTNSLNPATAATGFLSDTSRSGSSTPTTTNEANNRSNSRGGRRKNTTSTANTTAPQRGQKRKKEKKSTPGVPQQPMLQNQNGLTTSIGMNSMSMHGSLHSNPGIFFFFNFIIKK